MATVHGGRRGRVYRGIVHRAQQYALHRAALAASPIAADEALASLDPLLRLWARRGVRRLIRRAERSTIESDPAHQLRLAFLLGCHGSPEDADEVAAVSRAFAESEPPSTPGRTGPWFSGVVLLVCAVVLGGAFMVWERLRPFSPRETLAGELLGVELPGFVVALARGDSAEAEQLKQRLATRAEHALGADAATKLEALLGSMERVRAADAADAERHADAYTAAAVGFVRALEAAQLPYFVDAELLGRSDGANPLLLSYYVQREARVTGVSPAVRVVELWKLDDLNVAQGYLGFTRPHTPAAIVLLDQVEEHLVRFALPAAAPEGAIELVDRRARDAGKPWVREVERRGTEVAQEYYRSLGEPLAGEARRIGELLFRRRQLVRRWQSSLRGLKLELVVPTALFPKVAYEEELELRVPRADLRDWQALHEELRERIVAFEQLRDLYVAGVTQHEVQHRLDYARGLMPVPESLCRLLGLDNPLDAPVGSLPARARDEMSAYLAEVARSEHSPMLELLILSHFVLDRDQGRSAYTYAAVAVYQVLARELGVDVAAVLGRGAVTRERFARLALEVWSRPVSEIQAAGLRAYEAELGTSLEAVSIERFAENARYRP